MATPVRSLLREVFMAGDTGALEKFRDLLHDDVVVHAPFGLSTSGLPAEEASWRSALEATTGLNHEFHTVVVDGEMEAARCVVTGVLTGTYGGITGSGTPFKIDQALFARTRDGKFAELWEIVDTETLRRQLERSEQ